MNYAVYLWSAYAVAFAVLLWNSAMPYWQYRRLQKKIKKAS